MLLSIFARSPSARLGMGVNGADIVCAVANHSKAKTLQFVSFNLCKEPVGEAGDGRKRSRHSLRSSQSHIGNNHLSALFYRLWMNTNVRIRAKILLETLLYGCCNLVCFVKRHIAIHTDMHLYSVIASNTASAQMVW